MKLNFCAANPCDNKYIPRPIFVQRKVLNAQDIIAWAKAQGFTTTLEPDDLHVTVAYSKAPIAWSSIEPDQNTVTITGGDRQVVPLGNEGAVVLKVQSQELHARWTAYRIKGASWDYESYQPHITITYNSPVDAATVEPYTGVIELGPELQQELEVDKQHTESADLTVFANESSYQLHIHELEKRIKVLLPYVDPEFPAKIAAIPNADMLFDYDSEFFSTLDAPKRCWYARCLIKEAQKRGIVASIIWQDNKELQC